MRCFVLAAALLAAGLAPAKLAAQAPAPKSGSESCVNDARIRATKAVEQGMSIEAASCLDPSLSPMAARLVGTVNLTRAQYARDFLQGKLTPARYRAILDDRSGKLQQLVRDPDRIREVLENDADGDLVADRLDRCPGTPHGVPTDANGCPLRVQPTPEDQSDDRSLRAILSRSRFLYNRSCDGAPPPRITTPLEWGRGPQTKLGTQGFNLAVAKVIGQQPGCEVFYEVQFRFIDPNPGNPALPPSKILTIVFSDSEDLLTDPVRSVLPLPVGPTLSPARSAVREAMLRQYFRASWRVRAVNGSNVTSHWSPFVTQGPASSGVDG